MSDDPRKIGLDRTLISLDEEHEVRSWTNFLGCTPEQLRAAVAAVGIAQPLLQENRRSAATYIVCRHKSECVLFETHCRTFASPKR